MRRLAGIAAAFTLLAACSGSDHTATAGTSTTSGSSPTASTTSPATTLPATTSTVPAPKYAATIDELLHLGRPIVLAHTGGEDNFPASTMYAFGESVKAGVDMLDLNVLLSKDGVLMVQHDETVDGSSDGSGKVGDLTAAQLQALDDAYWFTEACTCHDRGVMEYLYRGIRTGAKPAPEGYTADDFSMPTLAQLIQRFPDIPLNIEIKGMGAPARAAADSLAKMLHDTGRAKDTVVASFQDDIVSYFHQIAPDIEVSPGLTVLTDYVLKGTPIPDGMHILQLPPEYSGVKVITPELMARANADGNPVWVWPNNRALERQASYEDFLAQGIAGLNINFPAQGVAAVGRYLQATAVPAAASAGCDSEAPVAPGTHDGTFGDVSSPGTYIEYLPPAYDGATPLPLVLALHGWSQPPQLLATEANLPAMSSRFGFVAVTPDITRPVPWWDTSLDGHDVAALTGLLDQLLASRCIDTNRVYVTGMSIGAMMTSTLACALSGRIAAVAPVAGVRDPTGCTTTLPVPLIAFHGTADPYLSYNGGYGSQAAALPSPDGKGTLGDTGIADPQDAAPVPERVAAWAARNGCTGQQATSDPTGDVVLSDWPGCEAGDTRLYTVNDGGHSWPGSAFDATIGNIVGHTTTTIDATAIMWQFFVMHPLTH